VTVFGGTGFLGRRIVHHLHDADFVARIAARHPERSRLLFSGDVPDIETVRADATDEASVATAVSGAWAIASVSSARSRNPSPSTGMTTYEEKTLRWRRRDSNRRSPLSRRRITSTAVHRLFPFVGNVREAQPLASVDAKEISAETCPGLKLLLRASRLLPCCRSPI
jgi:NAD(P)H-binding